MQCFLQNLLHIGAAAEACVIGLVLDKILQFLELDISIQKRILELLEVAQQAARTNCLHTVWTPGKFNAEAECLYVARTIVAAKRDVVFDVGELPFWVAIAAVHFLAFQNQILLKTQGTLIRVEGHLLVPEVV